MVARGGSQERPLGAAQEPLGELSHAGELHTDVASRQ